MRKLIVLLSLVFLALSVCACSAFTQPQIEEYPILSTTPNTENTPISMQAELDQILQDLFPNGITQIFRDTQAGFETDETFGTTWSIYYADMSNSQYWNYISKLVNDSSYYFDIINSDRIAADVLISNVISSTLPAGGVIRTCLDDPNYAYLNLYYFNSSQFNSNGFRYTVRVDITLYNVDKNSDEAPDNTAKNGSIMGMDINKADELYFANDSKHYIVTELNDNSYGDCTQIEKYAFDDDGNILSKRIRLTFADNLDMLLWYYDNTSDTEVAHYYAPTIVGNTLYISENLNNSDSLKNISTINDLRKLLDNSNIDYYEK